MRSGLSNNSSVTRPFLSLRRVWLARLGLLFGEVLLHDSLCVGTRTNYVIKYLTYQTSAEVEGYHILKLVKVNFSFLTMTFQILVNNQWR